MCFHLFNASHILRSPQLLPSFHFPSLSMSLDLSVSPGGAGTRHIYILYTHILHYIISFLYIFSSFMLPGGAGLGGERARARGPDDQRLAYHPARPLRLRDAPAALPPHLPLRPRTGEASILTAERYAWCRHSESPLPAGRCSEVSSLFPVYRSVEPESEKRDLHLASYLSVLIFPPSRRSRS